MAKRYAVRGTAQTGAHVEEILTGRVVSKLMSRPEAEKLRDKLNAQETAYPGGFNKRLK